MSIFTREGPLTRPRVYIRELMDVNGSRIIRGQLREDPARTDQ